MMKASAAEKRGVKWREEKVKETVEVEQEEGEEKRENETEDGGGD